MIPHVECICSFSPGLCTAHPTDAPPVDWRTRALAAEAKLAEARSVLRSVEWSSEEVARDRCPACDGYRDAGHAPDCRLRAVLDAT